MKASQPQERESLSPSQELRHKVKEARWISYCLKGCLVVGTIIFIMLIWGFYFIINHSRDWAVKIISFNKSLHLSMLEVKDDGTRKQFEKAYDTLVVDLKKRGLIKFAKKHWKSSRMISSIALDGRITEDEAREFIEEVKEESFIPEK